MHLKQQWNKINSMIDKATSSEFAQNVVAIIKLPTVFLVAFLSFLEMYFHIVRFGFNLQGLPLKIFFAMFYAIIIGAVISFLPEKIKKIILIIITAIISAYYIAQLIYSGVFNTYLSISGTFHVAGQALDFTDVIWNELSREWWKIVIMLVPILWLVIRGRKKLDYTKHGYAQYIFYVVFGILTYSLSFAIMLTEENDIYSSYNVYRHYTSVDMSTQKLGVAKTFFLDTVAGVKSAMGQTEDVSFVSEGGMDSSEEKNSKQCMAVGQSTLDVGNTLSNEVRGIDTSPNVMDIDFNYLIENESNSNVKELHTYISGLTPTNKNEYTGMFEGYNVIFVVAEGFSGYVVDKQRTPMLYKMIHNGFYFKNYYTPLWYGSTLGGEYADLTGLMPKNGGYLSMEKAGANKNDMYFTLSEQLLRLGYTVNGYHANDYTYYDRQISHPNMGLNWVGVGNGYSPEYSEYGVQLWPQSDERLIDETFDLYSSEEHFYTYYLTVSGHVMYNFGGNAMSKKHQDLVEDLEYSETTKAYIACQYELELAMESLVEKLEAAGIADNTLIVLTADHVPYNDKEVVDELAGRTLDDTFEWYKNSLIIWSASMDEGIKVSKYCSSLDVLPTVSNLLGLEYDSRMMVGKDIMSDSEGVVVFNDRSFITDRCSYNANTGEVISIDGSAVNQEYVDRMKVTISNKFNMAQSICDYNYYRYIDPNNSTD